MQAFDAEAFVRKCFSEHVHSRVNDDDAGELAERVECLVAELHAAMGGRGDEGEPVTEESLFAMGMDKDEDDGGFYLPDYCTKLARSADGTYCLATYPTRHEYVLKTMANVRSLYHALGIPLPAAPGERTGE
jgi:hypothetical protein